jgi:hypothetical protein
LCTESRHDPVLTGVGPVALDVPRDGTRPGTLVGLRADGPWQQLQTFDGDGLDLVQLVIETEAPAISIYVVESEFGYIAARTPAGVAWWGYLNPETAVRDYEAPDPPAPVASIADRAVAWAAEADRNAIRADVAAALCERVGPFGEGVDTLMLALGFRFGDQLLRD